MSSNFRLQHHYSHSLYANTSQLKFPTSLIYHPTRNINSFSINLWFIRLVLTVLLSLQTAFILKTVYNSSRVSFTKEDVDRILEALEAKNLANTSAGNWFDKDFQDSQFGVLSDSRLAKLAAENPCELDNECYRGADQKKVHVFHVISGVASVVGPRVCWRGVDVLRAKLGNTGRGINVVAVNVSTEGNVINTGVFDMYANNSEPLKAYLQGLLDKYHDGHKIAVLMTSYDDAAFHLDDGARSLMQQFGFRGAENLAFRDNFVFLGGPRLTESYEKILKFSTTDATENKFQDWPDKVEIEGCLKVQ